MAAKTAAKKSSGKKKPQGATPAVAAQPKSAPGWVWMLTGLLAGLFVAFLFFLQTRQGEKLTPTVIPPKAAPAKPPAPKASEATQGNADLEFYKILPELQVKVPETSPKESAKEKKAEPAGTYVLQVGSFRRFEDADKRKASLALLGVESAIQKVAGKDGEPWYRVRIGPSKDLEHLHDVRVLLHKNMIETLLIKVEG